MSEKFTGPFTPKVEVKRLKFVVIRYNIEFFVPNKVSNINFKASWYSDKNRLLPVFAKNICQSDITTVISTKKWSFVQNFGTIEFRESGFAKWAELEGFLGPSFIFNQKKVGVRFFSGNLLLSGNSTFIKA